MKLRLARTSAMDYLEARTTSILRAGLDIATTDSRIYYLIAGTTPGKRVRGELQLDSPPVDPPSPTPTPTDVPSPPTTSPPQSTPASPGPVLRDPIFRSWIQNDVGWLMDAVPLIQLSAAKKLKRGNRSIDTPLATRCITTRFPMHSRNRRRGRTRRKQPTAGLKRALALLLKQRCPFCK